jgi:type II secretory pathway component PulK
VRTQRGITLLLTLGVMALLIAMLAMAAASGRLAFKAQENRQLDRRAMLAAQAGVQWAMTELAAADVNLVTLQDQWATTSQLGDVKYVVDTVSFRIQIVDAAAYINLNTVTEEQLQNLNLTTEQIACLLDWRSPELQARADGAKDDYYNTLQKPYNAKLSAFTTVDELLLVKGFTGADLYQTPEEKGTSTISTNGGEALQMRLSDLVTVDSVSPNTTATGTTKLNANNVQAQQMIQRGISPQVANAIVAQRGGGTFASLGAVLRVPGVTLQDAGIIMENLTVTGGTQLTGKINVNTASQAVLETLPGMTSDVATAIVSRQQSGIATMDELAAIPGVTLDMLQRFADQLAIGSQVFLVRCVGTAGRMTVAVEAAIKVTDGVPSLIRLTRCPFRDMTTRWEWVTDTASETVLVESK